MGRRFLVVGLNRPRKPTPEPWAPACPALAHSPMDRSILGFLLIAGAEIHQGVQVRLEKHVPQPDHVALEGGGTQEPHNPPEGWHNREALVGDGCEGHHHGQLLLGVISAAFQEGSNILVHLWSKLELARELQESGIALTNSPANLFHAGDTEAQQVPLRCTARLSCPVTPMLLSVIEACLSDYSGLHNSGPRRPLLLTSLDQDRLFSGLKVGQSSGSVQTGQPN